MKSIELTHLTPSGSFLYLEGNSYKEGTFQGLHFDNSPVSRFLIRPYLKQIQCSTSKGSNHLRYHNLNFYEEMLKLNIARLNPIQIEQTKVFTKEEKTQLKQVSNQIDVERLQSQSKNILDYFIDRKKLKQLYARKKKVQAAIQYLHEDFVISFQEQSVIHYVPLKLRNIQHYFHLIQSIKFSEFLHKNKTITIQLTGCKFNLVKQQYQLYAVLPEQIERHILAEGWGLLSIKNLNSLKPSLTNQYKKIEQQAKASHKGIFSKPFQILSLIYTKNNLVAIVQQVIEGYIFKLRTKNDELLRVELTKIYCPIQNEPGSFICRQFARKNLIGKDVNVFLTKDEGLNILGSIVRFSDNKDVETLMIQNGYGFVKEQLKGAMFYAKLESLQKKAKEARKGIHNQKSVGVQFYEDFTQPNSKKGGLDKKNSVQNKQKYLFSYQQGEQAVVQKIIDPVTYVVRVDSARKILKIRLDGVVKLNANPRLPQIIELQKNIQTFYMKNFNQRTVSIELIEYNENNNNFIGVIRLANRGNKQKLSFQQILLKQGLISLHNTDFVQQKWIQNQNEAQKKGKNIWGKNLRQFVYKDIFEQQQNEFKGKFSWIQDGQLAYVQPNQAIDRLDQIYKALSEIKQHKKVQNEDLVPGFLCAAQYQQQLSRARIVSIQKQVATVKFIDWGNKEAIPVSKLQQIPVQLQYIPPLCCEVILDLVRPLKKPDPEHLQNLRDFLMEPQCKFIKLHHNTVNIYSGNEHLNLQLILQGYLKADLSKIQKGAFKEHIVSEMNKLRKQLAGVWQIQDNDSDIQDPDENKYQVVNM